MKHYYVIQYTVLGWNRTHPHAKTLNEANDCAKLLPNSNVIHEMWLTCLAEWPIPEKKQ